MQNKIEWQFVKGKTDDEMIAQVEKILNIKFPDDYVIFIKLYPNGSPVPNFFRTKKDTFVFRNGGTFEYFYQMGSTYRHNILEQYKLINVHSGGDNKVPDGIVPFASASHNHDKLCFDYRNGYPPKIVLFDLQFHWDYLDYIDDPEFCKEMKEEDYLIPVCHSFSELLDMLEEEPKYE